MSDESPTCCLVRRKIVIGIARVLTEEECGVSEVELAPHISWNKDKSTLPILTVKFCPWCGMERQPDDEVRVVEIKPSEKVLRRKTKPVEKHPVCLNGETINVACLDTECFLCGGDGEYNGEPCSGV